MRTSVIGGEGSAVGGGGQRWTIYTQDDVDGSGSRPSREWTFSIEESYFHFDSILA